MKPGLRLLYVANDASFFLSHRLPLALAARKAGYQVQVATPDDHGVPRIRALGIQHHIISLRPAGRNPASEILTICSLARL